jgi:hypothetical protein
MYTRAPLSQRSNVYLVAPDVVEAIKRLMFTTDLPAAFSKGHVADQLALMAAEDSEGKPLPVSLAYMTMARNTFLNILNDQITFITGFKDYERQSELRTIPVSEYLFQTLFPDKGYCGDVLADMNDEDIQLSMTKKTTTFTEEDEAGNVVRMFKYGPTAGIVIFPSNYPSNLLAKWTARNGRVLAGGENAYLRRAELVLPEHPGVALLGSLVTTNQNTRLAIEPALEPPEPEEDEDEDEEEESEEDEPEEEDTVDESDYWSNPDEDESEAPVTKPEEAAPPQNTTYGKLCNTLGTHKGEEETNNDFKKRALHGVNDLTQEEYDNLSEDVKAWVKIAAFRMQMHTHSLRRGHSAYELPHLDGLDKKGKRSK